MSHFGAPANQSAVCRVSSRFDGVLSTNCQPRDRAPRRRNRLAALPTPRIGRASSRTAGWVSQKGRRLGSSAGRPPGRRSGGTAPTWRFKPGENVVHVEHAASEMVGPVRHEVWDVHCTDRRWWVVTNPTNPYHQAEFKSLDVVLTFHIGLALRAAYLNERRVPVAPQPALLLPGSWRRWQRTGACPRRRRWRNFCGRPTRPRAAASDDRGQGP
jgi:hypothetical protein